MEILNILSNTSIIRRNTIDGLTYCTSYSQAYEIHFFLDTCALQANNISKTFAHKVKSQGCGFKTCNHSVCTPIKGGICETSQGILPFNVKYLIFSSKKYDNMFIEAWVLDLDLCYLIIGLHTIRIYNLVSNLFAFYPFVYRNWNSGRNSNSQAW